MKEIRTLIKNIIQESLNDEYQKYILLYNLGKETTGGESLKTFQKLYDEVSKSMGSDEELFRALKQFKTAEEFADYMLNKRGKTGEYLFPTDRGFKSDAEMLDFRKTHARKK